METLKIRSLKDRGIGQLVTRIAVATVMWPHGAQLLLGLFGGLGFTNTMNYFTEHEKLPWAISLLVILIQFFGSLFILFGLFTRINSLLMTVIAVGMIFSGHIEHGFFMNWFGSQSGEGFEFHILLIGLSLSLVFESNYKYSLDSYLFKDKRVIIERGK